ncbi:MAG: VTT domain-containing protein [Herpetosiphonaceae bacterium]|nr:VTT domain-containing protein [Herpetosiphonaceae bacterium]
MIKVRPSRRVLVLVVVLLVGLVGVWVLRLSSTLLSLAMVRQQLHQLGPWGPLALILGLATLLVIPVIPATLLQVGAGLAFGPVAGLFYVLVADVLGATIGFALARRWGAGAVSRWLSTTTEAQLGRLVRRISWHSVMLLRLLPGPAYPLVSLAAGLAQMRFSRYILASFCDVLPSLALLVLAGDLVTRSPWLAFGLVVVLVLSLALLGRLIAPPEQ